MIRAGSAAFAGGVLYLSGLVVLPGAGLLIPVLPLCMAALYFRGTRLAGLVLLGFIWALMQANLILEKRLPRQFDGESVLIHGTVASLPEKRANAVRFLFEIDNIRDKHGQIRSLPGKVRLSWYGPRPSLKPGEFWQLYAKLRRPRGFINPGGFDYETWLFQKKISATGYVKASPKNKKISATNDYLFHQWRHKTGGRIDDHITGKYAGLIKALAIGDRSGISDEHWVLLRKTGTNHLLAISGLHIGLVAFIAFSLGRVLWSWNMRLTTLLPARQFAALFSILIGVMYAGLAGFSLPTQRALIMLCVFMSGILLGRQWRISYVIAIAVFLILLIHPFSVLAVEFWLSFAAVVIIAYALSCRGKQHRRFNSLVRIQFLIPFGMVPLLLFWFQEIAVNSFFANLLAVPTTTLIIVPLTLLATLITGLLPEVAGFLYESAVLVITLMFVYLEFLGNLPFSSWASSAPSLMALLFAGIGMAVICMPAGVPGRWLGLCWLMPLLWPNIASPRTNGFHFYLLDVGQGLAAVVSTRNHTLLYDSGPFWSDRFNAGRNIIIPFLRSQRISKIDTVLLSHGDNDHIGGADSVLDAIKVGKVLASTDKITFGNKWPCVSGMRWHWDGVDFETLHPRSNTRFTGNNSSCVLKVSSPDLSVLLPGDIEYQAEQKIVAIQADKLQADVLVVPHHGSMTSSSPRFIDAVSPRAVLFSVGYQNRFGFPKQDIIERYNDIGAKMLSTADSGMIAFASDDAMTFTESRRQKRRFWHSIDKN